MLAEAGVKVGGQVAQGGAGKPSVAGKQGAAKAVIEAKRHGLAEKHASAGTAVRRRRVRAHAST